MQLCKYTVPVNLQLKLSDKIGAQKVQGLGDLELSSEHWGWQVFRRSGLWIDGSPRMAAECLMLCRLHI